MSYTIRIEERINSLERTVEVTGVEPQATLDVMRAVRGDDMPARSAADDAARLHGELLAIRTERDALARRLEEVEKLNAEQAVLLAVRGNPRAYAKLAGDLEACSKAAEELRQDRERWRERAVHYAPAEKKLEYMNEGFAGRPERQ